MGVDIHTYLVKDKQIIAKNLYDGRNSEWFSNLRGNGDKEYDYLPVEYHNDEAVIDEIKKDIDAYGGWGTCIMSVKEYIGWYKRYKPDLKAGWLSKHEEFLLDKGVIPDEYNVRWYLEDGMNTEDYSFCRWIDPYNCDSYLVSKIMKVVDEKDWDNTYLVYFFDN